MKILLLAILVSGVCARPQIGFTRPGVGSIGLSGVVLTDGTIEHFTPEFIEDIVEIGPAGIVTKSGKNFQLTRDLHRVVKRHTGFSRAQVGSIGYSGIVLTDGTIIHFTPEFIEDIVSIGESGITTKSGRNVQLTRDLHRVKRSHIMNDSGILTSWGEAVVFKKPFTTIVADGPGGIVFSDGTLLQKPLEH